MSTATKRAAASFRASIISTQYYRFATPLLLGVGLVGLAACATVPTPEIATPLTTQAAPTPTPNLDDPTSIRLDAGWECGQVSALISISSHANQRLAAGEIDGAAHAERLRAAQDAWLVTPRGDSDISKFIRDASAAAQFGVGDDNAELTSAVSAIVDACEANGSPVATGMLPSAGG